MPKVQLTIYQNPIEVPEDEVATLRAQGLLVEDAPAPEPAAATEKPAGPAGEKPDAKEKA